MATGIISKPPSLLNRKQQNRYDNLQARAEAGDLKKKQQRKLNKLSNIASGEVENPKAKYTGLNASQNQSINQRTGADISLGQYGNELLPRAWESYSKPFDWNALPSAPVQGDFNDWRQGQIDSTYNDFTRRMDPQFAKETQDFEQQMANRGIPVGSELYNSQKQQLVQQQNDARNSALVSAQGLAGQNANQFFDIGTQARSGALSEGLTARDMPLSEFNKLYASRSPMDMQNLQYSQNQSLQNSQYHPPVFGPQDPYQGFGSAQNFWAAQDARDRANQQWAWANQPKQKGPSYAAQIGGGILGTAAGIGGGILAGKYL